MAGSFIDAFYHVVRFLPMSQRRGCNREQTGHSLWAEQYYYQEHY